MADRKITLAELKAALKSSAGIPAVAAEKLGCSRQNVCQRIASTKELQDWIAEIDQTITDQAQANVVLGMQERQPGGTKPTKAAMDLSRWWLDRKGRDRGFSTRHELTDPNGNPLQLTAPTQVNIITQYVTPADQVEDVV